MLMLMFACFLNDVVVVYLFFFNVFVDATCFIMLLLLLFTYFFNVVVDICLFFNVVVVVYLISECCC